MKLSDLTKKTRTVAVTVDDQEVPVKYRVHVVTPGFLAAVQELDDLDAIMYQIEQVIVSWDVLDDDGNPIPATKEAILKFGIPLEFLTRVLTAITADMRMSKDEKNS